MKTIELGPPPSHSFFNISLKKYNYLDSFITNIFNTYTLKRYGWFSLHHLPTPQYFLHPSKKLLPAFVVSLRMQEKTINVSFEELKEKGTFFARELSRQKGLGKLCEIFES